MDFDTPGKRQPAAREPSPESKLSDRAQFRRRFEERYVEFQYHYVEFITEHLADCSRVFGGDLQQVVLMAIIGQVFLRSMMEKGRDPAARGIRSSITTSRLADATGIPRETARRKLADLERKGWIERAGSGWQIRMVDGETVARTDLADLDSRGIDRLAKLYIGLRSLDQT